MLRKSILTSLALAGISSTALAGAVSGVAAPSYLPVTVPTEASGLILGVEGLYWTPTNSKLAYGILDEGRHSDDDPTGKILFVEPEYHLAFDITLGYLFQGHGNDILLKYTHFSSGDSDSKRSEEEENHIWTRLLHPNDSFDQAEKAKAKVNFDYDAIDFLLGQMIDVGDRLRLHLATGLHYAKLDTKFKATYFYNDDDSRDKFGIVKLDSEYNGVGPQALVSGKYKIGNGLSFIAEVGASILLGNSEMKERQDLEVEHCRRDDVLADVKQDNIFQTVPELNAKLALSFGGGQDYVFCIEGGWKVENYFDVRNNSRFVDDAREGVYTHHTSNISFSGPYLGLNILAG